MTCGPTEQTGYTRAAIGIMLIFMVLCVRNIFDYSPTYDETKFLRVGERLADGEGWQTEMSVVHAPLSFYTHGLLLRPFEFPSEEARLRWARATMLLYSVALGTLVFLWGSKLYGMRGGMLALVMYCFNSNILGHSALITTDIIYACFSLFLLYAFWRFMTEGKKRWMMASGACLGLALLSKYSAVLWFLLLPGIGAILLVIDYGRSRKGGMTRNDSSYPSPAKVLAAMIVMFLIAIAVLNAGYGFSGSFMPIGASHYQSASLARLSTSNVTSWIPLPVPYPFMRGFDSQKLISEVGHPSFLGGMHSTQGWWYYYGACFLLKMPAAFWPILVWAGIGIVRREEGQRKSAEMILILSSLAILVGNSFLSRSHAGFRYVLASVPAIFVLAGAAATNASTPWKKRVLAALLVMYVVPALWIHPHHIAYFSELVGGSKNGYKWLSDSNLDWGQDLRHARAYVRESDVPITVNPGMMPVPGRILINATTLQDCFAMYDSHGWLRTFEPVDHVGYSWLVFDVTERDVANRRHVPGRLPDEYYFGAFEYARDRLQSAERFALAALDADPQLPEALYLLGLSRLGLGKPDEAADAFEGVPSSHPFYVDARSNMSFIAAVRGDSEAGRKFRKQSMVEETLRAYAERPTLDVRTYSELSVADPGSWKAHNNLGVALWAQGTLLEAEKEIRVAFDLQPDFAAALSNLAIVLEDLGRFDEALGALTKYRSESFLLRTAPYRDYRVYYQDTRVMFGDTLELFPKADKDVLRLKSYLARYPNSVSSLNRLSTALMTIGRLAEAYETVNHAISLNPGSSELYTNLAAAYVERKMFDRAISTCERAIEIDSDNSSAAELLSSIRSRLTDAGEVEPIKERLDSRGRNPLSAEDSN